MIYATSVPLIDHRQQPMKMQTIQVVLWSYTTQNKHVWFNNNFITKYLVLKHISGVYMLIKYYIQKYLNKLSYSYIDCSLHCNSLHVWDIGHNLQINKSELAFFFQLKILMINIYKFAYTFSKFLTCFVMLRLWHEMIYGANK